MILHRFMSEIEYAKLMRGEVLTNTTIHRLAGSDSDAVGFCFFAENPEDAVHWLNGAACTDVCVTFNVPDGFMHEAQAHYRDPRYEPTLDPKKRHPKILRTDYCIVRYSKAVFPIITATTRYRMDELARSIAIMTCRPYRIYLYDE